MKKMTIREILETEHKKGLVNFHGSVSLFNKDIPVNSFPELIGNLYCYQFGSNKVVKEGKAFYKVYSFYERGDADCMGFFREVYVKSKKALRKARKFLKENLVEDQVENIVATHEVSTVYEKKRGAEFIFEERAPYSFKKWVKQGALFPKTFGNKSWREGGKKYLQTLNDEGFDFYVLEIGKGAVEVFCWKKI